MIVIVDYGLGNLFSVQKAFEILGAPVKISGTAEDIHTAERIVLPGVGAFGDGMEFLRTKGLDRALTEEVIGKKKPFLGICLGLQFLAETGEEHGEHRGLGWIKGRVRKLAAEKQGLKIPHIGWNELTMVRASPMFTGINPMPISTSSTVSSCSAQTQQILSRPRPTARRSRPPWSVGIFLQRSFIPKKARITD